MSANDILTEARFWAQVITDAERTVVCSPEDEPLIRLFVEGDVRGLGLTVKVSPFLKAGTLLVIDERAMAASMAKPLRFPTGSAGVA